MKSNDITTNVPIHWTDLRQKFSQLTFKNIVFGNSRSFSELTSEKKGYKPSFSFKMLHKQKFNADTYLRIYFPAPSCRLKLPNLASGPCIDTQETATPRNSANVISSFKL